MNCKYDPDASSTLKAFRRWISGKGRKYIPSDVPVSIDSLSSAIDNSLDRFKYSMRPPLFRQLVEMADRGRDRYSRQDSRVIREAKRIAKHYDRIGA